MMKIGEKLQKTTSKFCKTLCRRKISPQGDTRNEESLTENSSDSDSESSDNLSDFSPSQLKER